MDYSRAINQIYSLRQGDVLPCLCLSWNGSHTAASLLHQGIDDTTFACVRVPNEANGNVFLVLVKDVELLQELDQSTLSEGVGQTGLESDGWSGLGQVFDPFVGDGGWNQIAFVQDEDEMLVGLLMLEIMLNELRSGSIGVSGVQNIE